MTSSSPSPTPLSISRRPPAGRRSTRRNSANGGKPRREVIASFAISPLANMVTLTNGRTITWLCFQRLLKRLKVSSVPGRSDLLTDKPRRVFLIRKGQRIFVDIPRKSYPAITPKDIQKVWNPNLGLRLTYRQSVLPRYLRSFISIVQQLEKRSSKSVATSKGRSALAARYTRLLRLSSTSCGNPSVFHSCTPSGVTPTTSTTTSTDHRRLSNAPRQADS